MDQKELKSGMDGWRLDWVKDNYLLPKAQSLIRTLVYNYTLRFCSFDGLACMDHDSHRIYVNLREYVEAMDPYYDKIPAHWDTYKKRDAFEKVFIQGFLGLIAHEIGHALYTLPGEKAEKLMPANPQHKFIHFCLNVVEDSYIQNKMKERFAWGLLRDSLDTSTALFQGLTTCEDFMQKKTFTIKDKLFYFILRSYNKNFLPPEGCDVPEDLINEFLSFYYDNDMVERCKATIDWSIKVYDWLKDEFQKEQSQQPNQNGSGSSANSSSSSSSSSSGGSASGQDSSQGKGGKQSGNQDGKDNQNNQQQGSNSIDQAIGNMIDDLVKETGIGSGDDATKGELKESDVAHLSATDTMALSNGIGKVASDYVEPLNSRAKDMLKSFNLHFQRLQLHNFNGTAYNQTSGQLDQGRIYKSGYTPRIFTRNLARKREMDLYVGVALDVSGSMDDLFGITRDITVPMILSLESVKAHTELIAFDHNTYKVKDYSDTSLSKLYASTDQAQTSGGTDLQPVLEYYLSAVRVRQHKDKCIVVITDGESDHGTECVDLVTKLKQQGVCVVGVGLRLGDCHRQFDKLFGSESFLYEDNDDIQARLAADLTKYLSNKFMRR